jgi:hypothetical protein
MYCADVPSRISGLHIASPLIIHNTSHNAMESDKKLGTRKSASYIKSQ